MEPNKLDREAQDLIVAAEAQAKACGDRNVSGTHVLLAAFRKLFPSLARAFRPSRLEATQLADEIDKVLKSISLEDADSPLYADMLKKQADGKQSEIGPDVLIHIAFEQNDPGTQELRYLLQKSDPQLLERLQSLTPVVPVPPGELRLESLSPRIAGYLRQAQVLAQARQISTRLLTRVCLSEIGSLLSEGLIAIGAYDSALRLVGGKVRLPVVTRVKAEIAACSPLLQRILCNALNLAVQEGQETIDERSLTLALIADARSDTASDLAGLGAGLREFEAWVSREPSSPTDDRMVGEIAMDQILPFLRSRVINQEPAIAAAYGPIRRVRLELGFEDALAATLLFVGPPGVGKSYLATLMAQTLYGYDPDNPEAHLVMIECGRYKDAIGVSDLMGAHQGYVGHDKGILREGVRDKAPCVIVFDEAERMNVQIWDSLLTMLNDGALRDNEGHRYSLKDCMVVLTSNKGIDEAEEYRRAKLMGEHAKADAQAREARCELEGKEVSVKPGPREILNPDDFWSHDDYRESYQAILLRRAREHFGPALYNRIDEKIGFNGLRTVDYIQIASNAIDQLVAHLQAKTGVRLWYQDEVAKAVAGAVKLQIDASARDINRFVRKYILDEAFAPLKLKEIQDKTPLAKAYQITAKFRDTKNTVLERFDLIATEPPESMATKHV